MDRLNQLKGETGGSRDLTLDTSSPPSESFMTANDTSSTKYFSLAEVDSTFDVSPSKDSAISTAADPEPTLSDSELISNLSPIPKKVDNFQIGKQIEAANILSGGVNIFDDNDNSYDGDELVIDDNCPMEDSPKSEDVLPFEKCVESVGNPVNVTEAIPRIDTEVVLQIDGKNVDAISIGNGLYLYRKGEEELAAVQMIDDNQEQPSFKFLKVRENAEGNLEVYEEIEVEVPEKVPAKEEKAVEKKTNVPVKDISIVNDTVNDTLVDNITPKEDKSVCSLASNLNIELQPEVKAEVNLNGKKVKLNESRKSPLISTFTPMTYHSTPNKEGIPLTKTMVDQQLHPNRHSDNIKKTIEVKSDSCKRESPIKDKDIEASKLSELSIPDVEKLENKTIHPELLDVSNVTEQKNDSNNLENINQSVVFVKEGKDSENINTNAKCELKTNNIQDKTKKGHDDDMTTVLQGIPEVKVNKKIDSNEILEIKVINNESKIHEKSELKLNNIQDKTKKGHADDRTIVFQDIPEVKVNKKIDSNEILEIKVINNESKIHEKCELKTNNIQEKIIKGHDDDRTTVLQDIPEVKVNKKIDSNEILEIKVINNESKIHIHEPNNKIKTIDTDLKLIEEEKTNVTRELIMPVTGKVLTAENKKHTNMLDTDKILLKPNENINIQNNSNEGQTDACKPEELAIKNILNAQIEKKDTIKDIVQPIENIDTTTTYVASNTIPIIGESNNISSKIELPTNVAKTEVSKVKIAETKSSNNSSAVPFGKWTEANRQEFLNKIKETKIPCSTSHTKQLKQANDLNRRDVLKKIDTQRQAYQTVAKNQDFGVINKTNVKAESTTVFVNKSIPSQKLNQEVKKNISEAETLTCKSEHLVTTKKFEEESVCKEKDDTLNISLIKKLPVHRKEINNQDLIDKTIEGIINRAVSTKPHEEWKQTIKMDAAETLKNHNSIVSLDDMEKKMNELHGIPFVERPAHELPQVHGDINTDKSINIKSSNIPLLLPFKNKLQKKDPKDKVTENISDEEIIEHEPITGDMTANDTKINVQSSRQRVPTEKSRVNDDESKKETIITEKDFDKFVRRNSITYENCLTVNFDGRESHNVIQTLIEKEVPKKLTRNEMMLAESKAKSANKHLLMRHNVHSSKLSSSVKGKSEEDSLNKNFQSQSKVQLAYQSALTAKRQLECPVNIIEDKPVKVVFLDPVTDFTTSNLNMQGPELSPPKKPVLDSDSQSVSESLDSDVLDAPYEMKLQDEIKSKSKHQRKQVLTPVDIPELELIEPSDLGINESPKKKRKLDETKEKITKTIAPKKSYLLNRAIADEKSIHENPEIRLKETRTESKPFVTHSDTISAIDNLVKAAELIETQSENKGNPMNLQMSESSLNTPAKRGRGRPRKYPLSETIPHMNKTPSIQKKPRLIESNISKKIIESDHSDESEDSNSNEEFIRENWTMGKINENIVCPICNKLFRSENVVFKHVKHCTGPSPNRSDSDRRSLRQFSQSEGKSFDSDSDTSEESEDDKDIKTKVKATKPVFSKKDEIIVIEDTPVKEKIDEARVREINKAITKHNLLSKTDNLVCEYCGKTFRQLSYLVKHKQQHKKDDEKKKESNDVFESKSIFSCEVCKKEFRKLHHLVQHRMIHNSNPVPSRLSRKNSNDKNESNLARDEKRTKRNDDQSAGFRCEPCDKSFRKLHHLVEHRETHDGINKKGSSNNAQTSGEVVKSSTQYICGICKKSFKKLQHLTEHKEHHLDSCSEKSDDKSVKSSLSTKDIIHECSLCYMVFPNEHSLNKHTIFCLRKKKQSAAKQAKLLEQKEKNGEDILDDEDKLSEDDIQNLSDKEYESETINDDDNQNKSTVNKSPETIMQKIELSDEEKISESKIELDAIKMEETTTISDNNEISHLKRNIKEEEKVEKTDDSIGKQHGKIRKIEVITIPDTPTPKKKIANVKEKRLPIGTKRQKTCNIPLPVVKREKIKIDSSDDDEIRYMLNPNFKEEDTMEENIYFMKVRASKRNSLKFEVPNPKDLIKRRISSQNPSRVQRSKAKSTESKSIKIKTDKNLDIPLIIEHTDSDDSDVKYSFPEAITQNDEKDKAKTVKRQSLVAKRKSLTGIARRKSLTKHKLQTPTQKVKRRKPEVEHRCDCGQLFSSAALLVRHTTLAHTPPRVRRQRDPPPDKPTQTCASHARAAEKRKSVADNQKTIAQQKNKTKSVASSNTPPVKTTRKSSAASSESKTSCSNTVKVECNLKTLRSAAHRGVPVPDKMRKLMERSK